jgi:hypothetical protein
MTARHSRVTRAIRKVFAGYRKDEDECVDLTNLVKHDNSLLAWPAGPPIGVPPVAARRRRVRVAGPFRKPVREPRMESDPE